MRALHDPLQLALAALAVYRMTRLITEDEVTRPARERISNAHPDGRAAYFVTCPWCVSFWLAALWVLALWLIPDIALGADAVLALSAVAGLLSSWE